MAIFLKRNGSWQEVEEPYIKRNDDWILPEEGYIKENGEWKLIFERFDFEVETVSVEEDINEATFAGNLAVFEDFENSNFFEKSLSEAKSSPAVAVDGNRQKVAVGSTEGEIFIYNRGFDVENTLSNPSDQVLSCSYNSSTGRLAVGSADNNVYVYDSEGNLKEALTGSAGEVTSVEINETTGQIAAGSKDENVYVYDSNLVLTDTISQPSDPVKSLAWRESDGFLLVSSTPGEVTVFDDSFSVTTSLSDASGETRVAAEASNGRVAVLDSDRIHIYTKSFSLADHLSDFDETASGTLGDISWDDTGRLAHASRNGNLHIYNSSYENIRTFDETDRRFSEIDWGTNEAIAAGANQGGQGDCYIFSAGVAVFFEYGQEGSDLPNRVRAGGRTALGQFSTTAKGLQPDTSYEVRAGGETAENRESFGETIAFTTSDTLLEVDTLEPENVFTNTADLRGEITNFAGFTQGADVFFEWGEEGSGTTNTAQAGVLQGAGTFEENIEGLEDGTTYVYKAAAEADGEKATGPEVTFSTTDIQLSVETLGASGVQSQSAILNGDLTGYNGFSEDATVEFEWGEQGQGYPNTSTADQSPLGSTEQFSAEIDVDPAVSYEYRARAEAESVSDTGDVVTFTTQDTTLQVETGKASSVTFDSATLNGELTAFSGFSQGTDADVRFEWGEAGKGLPKIADSGTLGSTGSFDAQISGLKSGTAYEYRAVAEAGTKTKKGSILQLTTDDVQITVNTLDADQVQKTSAQINGELAELGGTNSTEVNFAWGKVGNGTPNETPKRSRNSTGSFKEDLTGLDQNTDYEFKAQAGSEEGSLKTFATSEYVIAIESDNWSFNNNEQKTFGQDLSVDVQVSGTGGNDYSYSIREFINGNDQGVATSASGVSGQSFTANWSLGDSTAEESDFGQEDKVSYEVKVVDQNSNDDTAGSPDISYQKAPAIEVPNTKSFFAQKGDQQTRSIEIRETSGFEDLSISGASIVGTDSEEFSYSSLPSQVASGRQGAVDVTYSPSQVATDSATFEVEHNGENVSSPASISLEGNARQVPLIEVSPESHDFGDTPVGNAPTKDFTVEEVGGDTDLSIDTTTLTGDSEFNITQDIPDGTTIPANGSDVITIKYEPQNPGVTSTGTLTIESDADNEPTFNAPLEGNATAVPAIEVSPDGEQDLGTISTSDSASKRYTITENSGEGDLSVSVGFAQNPSDWLIQNDPSTVSAGSSENFTVKFDPSGPGEQNVTVEIDHDATNMSSPITRDLSAQATQESTISVSPSDGGTLDFGSIVENETKTEIVTISETGGSNGFGVSGFNASGSAFTISSSTPSNISASGSETIDIEFNPPSEGNYSETFTFDHDAVAGDNDQSVTIGLSATAESESTISTTPSDGGTLTFAATAGQEDTDTVTISEVGGGESFEVTSWDLSENSSGGSEFNILDSPGASFTVDPVSSEEITIEYQPNDDIDDTGTFEINHDASDGPSSPISIDISGSSSAPATFGISSTSQGFGEALVDSNESNSRSITIEETGGDNGYNISSQDITSGGGDFSITNAAPSSLNPGDSGSVTLEFDPGGSVSGSSSEERTGDFQIEHDASEGNDSPVDVSLSGTALKRAAASISTNSISFGQVPVGESESETIQIFEDAGNEGYDVNIVQFKNEPTSHYSSSGITTSTSVSAGGSESGTITFSPSNTGTKQNELQIGHDAENGSDPLLVTLEGEGTQETTASSQSQTVDFGTVSQNSGTKTESFSISETSGNGSYNVTGSNLTNNNQEYSLTNIPNSVGSGSTENVDVIFDTSTGQTGQIDSTAEISHGAPGGPNPLTVDLSATVTVPAIIDISTESLSFPDTTVGNTSTSQSFTVEESGGDQGFNITGKGLVSNTGGNDANQFNVPDPVADSISAGGSDTVSIEFDPQDSGSWNASYRFTNDASEDANDNGNAGDATVNLTGTALAPASIEGQNPSGGTTIDFPNTVKGQEESVTIDLVETGGDNGAYYGDDLTGDTQHFSTSGQEGSVGAGSTDSVTLSFTPSGTGQFSATIDFNWQTANSDASGTVTYTLTGTGISKPNLEITPDPLDFGTVQTGSTSQKSLTFEETTGSDSISVYNIDDISNQQFSFVNSDDTSFDIGPAQSREVEIEFSPDSTDSFLNTYEATYNSSSLNNSQTTDLQAIQGEGENPSAPSISVTSSTTEFGPVEADASENVQGAFVVNETSGDKDLHINSISFNEGPRFDNGPDAFTVTNSVPSTLGAGQSADVDVEFDPGGQSGLRTSKIEFDTDAQNNSNVEISINGDTMISFKFINWSFSSGEEFAGGQELSVGSKLQGIGASDSYDLRIEEKIVSGANSGLSVDILDNDNIEADSDGEAVFNENWDVGDGVGQQQFGDGAVLQYTVEVKHDGYTKTKTRSIEISEGLPDELELQNITWNPQGTERQFDPGETVVQGEVSGIRANTNDIEYKVVPYGEGWNSSGADLADGSFNFNKNDNQQFFTIEADNYGFSTQYDVLINEVDSSGVNSQVSSSDIYEERVDVSVSTVSYSRNTDDNSGNFNASWDHGKAGYRIDIENLTKNTLFVDDALVSTNDSNRSADETDVGGINDTITEDNDNIMFTVRDNSGSGEYFEDSAVVDASTFSSPSDTDSDTTDGSDGSDGSDFQTKSVEASEYEPSENSDEPEDQ